MKSLVWMQVMSIDDEIPVTGSVRERAEHAAALWISRRAAAGWDSSDQAALDAWLGESIDHEVAYYRLNGAWEEAGRLVAFRRHKILAPLRADGVGKAVRAGNGSRWALAASIVLAIAVGSVWWLSQSLFDRNHYRTVVGGLQSVPLSDGSRVTLNTDSDVRIALSADERRVELNRGEVFFEVAKDPQRPFVVDAGNKRIIAVGTAFSVFHAGNETRVKVTEGAVRVEDGVRKAITKTRSESPGGVLMRAGTIAQVDHDSMIVRQTDEAAIEQSLSWRSGILTFRDRPLADVVAEFNRYNERKIVIEDPSIADLQFGGVFKSTNVDPFVELLQQVYPVRARDAGDRIVLTHN